MTLEKICEYFNDIGILQLDNIDKFLKIYKQISQNNFKNKSDKIILALFTYITLISKNEQQLYNICRNIINNFRNNQILYRYRALYIINNIINTKLKSTYVSFFMKLNFQKNKKFFRTKINSPKPSKLNKRNYTQEQYKNENNIYNINFTGRIRKGKIVKKYKAKKNLEDYDKNNDNKNINIKNEDKIFRTFDNYENENYKECTFSPKINKYYKPKIKNQINNDIDNSSYVNRSNENPNYKKNNNVINEELEKMIDNISKYSGNPNNSKYIPKKTIYRTQYGRIYPSNSYQESQFYSQPNINIQERNNINYIDKYLNEDYEFYKNEKEHIKKVQDKIFQMKLKKLDKISQECTFRPEINEMPKYLYEGKKGENNLTDINLDYENNYKNNIYNINNNLNHNSFNNSKSFSRKRKNKLTEEFSDDYYNVYPKKRKNYSNSRSNSQRKNKKEFSVYKAKKEQLNNLFNEQYPFIPSIRENKKYQIKTSFDERQKKFLDDKRKLFEQKEKEQLKEIQEMKNYYNKSKANIKELVKKLYDKEAEKIKERLKIEKELSKKKKIIDWDKRNKINKEKYPEEYKINFKPKDKKLIESNSQRKIESLINKIKKENSIPNSKSKSKEKKKNNNHKIASSKGRKRKNEILVKKDEINKNQQLLLDKIKDEHVIGFKNNLPEKQNKSNEKTTPKKETKNNLKKNNDINSMKDSANINLDNESLFRSSLEEVKKMENEHLMDDINKKVEMKSNALKDLMNQFNNK